VYHDRSALNFSISRFILKSKKDAGFSSRQKVNLFGAIVRSRRMEEEEDQVDEWKIHLDPAEPKTDKTQMNIP
jgi:hypothetical protein